MKTCYSVYVLIFAVLLFGNSSECYAQTVMQKKQITSSYRLGELSKFGRQVLKESQEGRKKAMDFAQKNKIQLRKTNPDGSISELVKVDKLGFPIFLRTYNAEAAKSTRASFLNSGGGLNLELNGQNMTIGVWDGGHPRPTHQEFLNLQGKVIVLDAASPNLNFHAAHVVGTITAAGIDPRAKGMAPLSKVRSYDWNNDIVEAYNEASQGLILSNHSYGFDSEWLSENNYSFLFGNYIDESAKWDFLMNLTPHYLTVVAAGNDGYTNYNLQPLDPTKPQYDKLSGIAVSKNSLTVAAANDASIDAAGNLVSVTMASFSSQGPTDDLRIKPDITGNGVGLFSTGELSDDGYLAISGTSMATPNVSGTLSLIQQYAVENQNSFLKAATLKGLVLHTADNIGAPGPDAISGWGLLNAQKAVEVLAQKGKSTRVFENRLLNEGAYSIPIMASGTEPLSVSISWTDPFKSIGQYYYLNDPTPVLVNNLDLVIGKGETSFYPWRLTTVDQTSNNGANNVDPFERVDILEPNGLYHLTASHQGSIGLGQDYSLIISGLEPKPVLGTTESTDINSNSAKLTCEIIWEGQDGVNDFGFMWSDSQVDFDLESNIVQLLNKADFSTTVTGLKPNKTYYFKAFAENGHSKVYSDLISFTTEPALAVLGAVNMVAFTSSTADLTVEILSAGGVALTKTGFLVGETAGFATGLEVGGLISGENITASLSSLLPNKTYYVRGFAENSVGRSETAEFSFTTEPALAVLGAVNLGALTASTADLTVEILSAGGVALTKTGFLLGETAGFATGLEVAGLISGENFTASFGSLLPNKTYYVRGFAENSVGRSETAEFSFTTEPALVVLAAVNMVAFTSSTADLTVEILSAGGVALTKTGFLLGETAGFATGLEVAGLISGENFTASVSSLLPNKTYYVRGFAENSVGRSETAEFSFTTEPALAVLGVVNMGALTSSTADLTVEILSAGGVALTKTGFLVGETAGFATGLEVAGLISGENFTASFGSLLPNKTYYVRGFAKNSVGRSETAEFSFMTEPALAVLGVVNMGALTASTADLTVEILSAGGVALTKTGFLVGETAGFATGLEVTGLISGENITASLSSLLPNKTYYVRGFAENSVGRSETAEFSFKTKGTLPQIADPLIGLITDNSASINTTVLNTWNLPLKRLGFIWGENSQLNTINGKIVQITDQKSSFIHQLSGLKPSTTYYVKAFAENSLGIIYSSVFSFKTKVDQEKPRVTKWVFAEEVSKGLNSILSVNVAVRDNQELKRVRIYYKGIRQDPKVENWKTIDRSVEAGLASTELTFGITIKEFDELGVMHFIQVEDAFNNVFETEIGYSYLRYTEAEPLKYAVTHSGSRLADYRMFGQPLISNESLPQSFTKAYQKNDPAIWRLFEMTNKGLQELETTSISSPGKGFWMIISDKKEISFQGHVVKIKHDKPFVSELEAGWNLLSNPFPYEVSWIQIMRFNNIRAASVLSNPLFFDGEYRFRDKIKPFEGFYVFAKKATKLDIPIFGPDPAEKARVVETSSDGEGWQLKMKLGSETAVGQLCSSFGVNTAANLGLDDFNIPLLPELVQGHWMGIYGEEDDKTPYSMHVVAPANLINWKLDLNATKSLVDPVLSWEIEGEIPEGFAIYLESGELGERVDMTVERSIRLREISQSSLKFQYREKEKPAGALFEMLDPFPNPSIGFVQIPIQNFNDQSLIGDIKILNSNGSEVKKITGVSIPVGLKLFDFDLSSLPRGLYLVVFESHSKGIPIQTKKIWLN